MLNLYNPSLLTKIGQKNISKSEKISILYHDIFNYPLTFAELIKWKAGKNILNIKNAVNVTTKKGYYYIEGREGLIYKRLLRKRISVKKMQIAQRSANLLRLVPNIKMVGVTGSLAMENCSEDSDIDILIITKQNNLWFTRLLVYLLLRIAGYLLRKPQVKNEKDALCLNMWLDESDLVWSSKDRNIYSAHELAQIIPLVNKNKTYEKFIYKNKWILDYWPNSVRISSNKQVASSMYGHKTLLHTIYYILQSIVEKFCYWLQKTYMKNKITREVVTPTRALFHPQDWGKIIINRLAK